MTEDVAFRITKKRVTYFALGRWDTLFFFCRIVFLIKIFKYFCNDLIKNPIFKDKKYKKAIDELGTL